MRELNIFEKIIYWLKSLFINKKKAKENSDNIKKQMCAMAVQSGVCNHNCDTCAWYVLNSKTENEEIMVEELTTNELVDKSIKHYESMIGNLKEEIDCYKRINNVHKLMLEIKLGTVIDQELINALFPEESEK